MSQEDKGEHKIETNKTLQRNLYRRVFTREQKLVATVWYHERLYTGMSYEQLASNFKIRFNTEYPGYSTLRLWEKELFKKDSKNVKSRNLTRLLYVPYVKESLVRFPDLSMRARSQMLGMSGASLKAIFKNDLTPSDLALLKNKQISKETNHSQDNSSESTLNTIGGYHKENEEKT